MQSYETPSGGAYQGYQLSPHNFISTQEKNRKIDDYKIIWLVEENEIRWKMRVSHHWWPMIGDKFYWHYCSMEIATKGTKQLLIGLCYRYYLV